MTETEPSDHHPSFAAMSDPFAYTYPSPLKGFENLEPLPNELNDDGKSFKNPPAQKPSESYERFTDDINNGIRGGFDVHIYYSQDDDFQRKFSTELWERIRREFPELRIYKRWDRAIGPHPLPMFEINIFTPAQFGAFIPWLVINRGPLSALVHPNVGLDTSEEFRDHTQRATWMGQPLTLRPKFINMMLDKMLEKEQAKSGGHDIPSVQEEKERP